MTASELPIVQQREKILAAVQANQVVIIVGRTGSGKTTQLPQMLFEAGFANNGPIAIAETRRIAAITAAQRVADERGTAVGREVGYHIRFERKVHAGTKMKFLTCGILFREAIADPLLSQYACVIVDEAHERDLFSDFLLGYLRSICEKRPEFKVIITSATLDHQEFMAYFPTAVLVEIASRQFPITYDYRPVKMTGRYRYVDATLAAVKKLHQANTEGDVLVFLPGEREIRNLVERGNRIGRDIVFLPLYGGLSPEQQRHVFETVPGRKVIVATNVAENSITVPGIRYVVDSGLAKEISFNPQTNIECLQLARISRASADQRAGRAGRTGPGVCIRLYSRAEYEQRPLHSEPNITRTDLSGLLLAMKALGHGQGFPFLTEPPDEQWKYAYAALCSIGALDSKGVLTDYGRMMARLSLTPKLAHLVLNARRFGCVQEAVTIAAMLMVGRFFVRGTYDEEEFEAVTARFRDDESDFFTLLAIWDEYRKANFSEQWCRENFLHPFWMRGVRTIRAHVTLELERLGITPTTDRNRAVLGKTIVSSLPWGVLGFHRHRRYAGMGTYRYNVVLSPASTLAERLPQYVVTYKLRQTTRTFADCNHEVKYEWLEELVPQALDRHTPRVAEPESLRMTGTLHFERNETHRVINIDVDLARVAGGKVRSVTKSAVVVDDSRFPVAFLGLSQETLGVLSQSNIATLAQLPNTPEQLGKLGLTTVSVHETIKKLTEFGYAANTLPVRQKVVLAEPVDRLAQSFLERPIEALELSGKTLMWCWSVGIEKVRDLIAKTEKELSKALLAVRAEQQGQWLRTVDVADVVEELKDRLANFDLRLVPAALRRKYLGADREIPVLQLPPVTPADDAKAAEILGDQFPLFKKYREGGPEEQLEARNAITVENLGLSRKVAQVNYPELKRIEEWAMDYDDLFQEGCFGLMRSIEMFDYTRGRKFSTYAFTWIKAAIKRVIAEEGSNIRVPVHMYEILMKYSRVCKELEAKLDRPPTTEDLAQALGKSAEQIEGIISVAQFWRKMASLDAPLNDDEDDPITLGSFQTNGAPSPLDQFEQNEMELTVRRVLAESPLVEGDRRCLELYFGLNGNRNHTLEEVGDSIGVTRERVRQLIERAIDTMRNEEVWEQVHPYFPYLPKPAIVPKFTTAVADSSQDVTLIPKTREEFAQDVLITFSRLRGTQPEQLTKGGELPEALQKVRCEVIYELRKRAKVPTADIAQLLNLRDEFEAMEGFDQHVAERALQQVRTPEATTPAAQWDAAAIVLQVAEHYGCTAEELFKEERTEKIAYARHLAMYRLREELGFTFAQIGKLFNRHHSSVIHGYYRIKREKSSEPKGGER